MKVRITVTQAVEGIDLQMYQEYYNREVRLRSVDPAAETFSQWMRTRLRNRALEALGRDADSVYDDMEFYRRYDSRDKGERDD